MAHSPNERNFYRSPVGWIEITAQPKGIVTLLYKEPESEIQPPEGLLADCITQLDLYFSGNLKAFNLPLAPYGSPFQLQVWNELVKIPYGQVITYRDLANRLHGPTYTRIVGQANAKNPVSILIPCHRVLGMNGALTGYAGGLWRKKFLLELEQKGSRSDFNPTLFDNNQ
ncbi:MAG: methylated-DNA--[protein]-cysteine S-methyltransferase [Porphyromonadaceae bacterium]|nr:MAG: methylated-DNA--[protein]-cysteine S-methyltransferase [Porphyromonadaceae bacterium]